MNDECTVWLNSDNCERVVGMNGNVFRKLCKDHPEIAKKLGPRSYMRLADFEKLLEPAKGFAEEATSTDAKVRRTIAACGLERRAP